MVINVFKAIYAVTDIRVKVHNVESDQFAVSTGVRRGGVSSPLLFSLAVDWVLDSALRDFGDGIYISPVDLVSDLDFADDIALVASDDGTLARMLHNVDYYASMIGLQISLKKTKLQH